MNRRISVALVLFLAGLLCVCAAQRPGVVYRSVPAAELHDLKGGGTVCSAKCVGSANCPQIEGCNSGPSNGDCIQMIQYLGNTCPNDTGCGAVDLCGTWC